MNDINPNLEWYTSQSENAGLSPRCQYANVHRCPRYYSSLYLLGEVGITTKMKPVKIEELDKYWEGSELMPVINEHDTGIASYSGTSHDYTNFCPEITYDIFKLFASSLYKYTDEIDKDIAHKQLINKGATGDSWRWQWMHVEPMHYSNCPLYTQILSKPKEDEKNKKSEDTNEKIVTLKPTIFGMSIDINALMKKYKR